MKKIIVTKHKSIIPFLIKKKYITGDEEILTNVTITDIKGRHVIGTLPLRLVCYAGKYTPIRLNIPSLERGKRFSPEEIEKYILPLKTYKVRVCDFNEKEELNDVSV